MPLQGQELARRTAGTGVTTYALHPGVVASEMFRRVPWPVRPIIMRRMLTVRRSSQAFGRGTLRFIRPGNRKVLVYLREYNDDTILCVVNLSRSAQPVEINLADQKGKVPIELLGSTTFPPIGELPYFITLAPYGFYWFELVDIPGLS